MKIFAKCCGSFSLQLLYAPEEKTLKILLVLLAQDTSSLALFFILGPRILAKSIICKYFAHFINSFNSDTVHHAFGPLFGEGRGNIGAFFTGPMAFGIKVEHMKKQAQNLCIDASVEQR